MQTCLDIFIFQPQLLKAYTALLASAGTELMKRTISGSSLFQEDCRVYLLFSFFSFCEVLVTRLAIAQLWKTKKIIISKIISAALKNLPIHWSCEFCGNQSALKLTIFFKKWNPVGGLALTPSLKLLRPPMFLPHVCCCGFFQKSFQIES